MEQIGVITFLLIATIIEVTESAGIRRQLSISNSSSSSLTGASSGDNLGGCPQLRNDCNFDCLSIDDKGCITCTCSGSSYSSGLAGGSTLVSSGSAQPSGNAYAAGSTLTSATSTNSSSSSSAGGIMGGQQSDLNMNNCPKLPNNCNYDCLEIGNNGCITCTCTGSGSSNGLSGGSDLTSSGSSSGGQVSSANYSLTNGASGNSNNCPAFPNNCRAECARVDSNFCPICDCTTTSSGNSGNLGDCPPFPTNCKSDCLSVRSDGCPLCNCTSTLGNKNGNECPPFPTNCRADCLSISAEGCPLCSCTSGSSGGGGQSSVNNVYNIVKPGSGNNINNCPQFDNTCPAQCTSSNSNGCPICLCAASTTAPSSSQLNLKPNASSECPPTIPNCNSACLWTDDFGCVLCNGDCNDAYLKQNGGSSANSGTPAPATAQPGSPCPVFDSSCPAKCSSFDVKGCLICTCSVLSATTPIPLVTSTMITCPAFDSTTCSPACLGSDNKGCLSCDCGKGSNTGGTGTLTTAAPLVPTGSGTGTITNGPIIGTNCPEFDLNCPTGCASVDDNGCLRCTCSATNLSAGTKATAAPLVNKCPTFDLSCPANCAKVDSQGCLSCTCSGSSQGQGQATTAAPNTGNINNCPVFDTSCPAGCAKIDAKGCLSCTCKVNSTAPVTAPSTTQTRQTTVGPNTVCPAFDGSSCDVSCLGLDASGCLSCTCNKQTTPSPNAKTTAAPPFIPGGGPVTTFAPGATGGNFVPGGGFISTYAPGGTTGNFVPGGGIITTAAPSGTVGTFIPGGGFISTYAPQQSTANFVPGGGIISTFAPIMPGGITAGPIQASTTSSAPTQKVTAKCAKFDDSCPAGCAALDTQGCLKCTCSAQTNQTTIPTSTLPTQPTVVSTTHQTLTPGVCPPVRCLPPCNNLELGADNCPRCKCDATTPVTK